MNEVRYIVLACIILFLVKLRGKNIDFLHLYPLVIIDLLFLFLLLIYTIRAKNTFKNRNYFLLKLHFPNKAQLNIKTIRPIDIIFLTAEFKYQNLMTIIKPL